MKSLILCVDRDDDVGRKAGIASPIIGRRRVVEAALALGLADPEDSDTNALFAAVHLFDKETEAIAAGHDPAGRQVEVAAVAGHRLVGLRSDRELAKQIDEVLTATRADEVILVSDGAEDEQIMPILTSRVRVAHVHRSIVKQAPRLEGFLYTLTRMLDDDKLAKRFLLPLALVFMVWGIAFFFDRSRLATGLTLGIIGGWLFTHAMHWEHRVTRAFSDFVEGLRTGKVALVANLVMLAIFLVGIVQAIDHLTPDTSATRRALEFADAFLFYFIGGLLVRTAGTLFDEVLREGRASIGHWTFGFTLIALGFIGGVLIDVSIALMDGQTFTRLLSFDLVVRLLVGLAVMTSGIVVGRYVRSFFREEANAEA
jgi:putative membrane protein